MALLINMALGDLSPLHTWGKVQPKMNLEDSPSI